MLPINGPDSVYGFIRRSAERDGGSCRWRTVDYGNKPQYDASLFNGVGGIPLFLAAYGRRRGNAEALELAQAALEWCADPAREGSVRGLCIGKAGAAFTAWRTGLQDASPRIAALCERVTSSILDEDPGPFTDMLGGAASNGWYLLAVWQRTAEPRLLAGAERCGEWLLEQMTRDGSGCHCLPRPDGGFGTVPYTGFAHGISGVAFFLAALFEASRDERWKHASLELFDTLIADARPAHGGWNWTPLLGTGELSRCQWSHGAAGIGPAFLRAWEMLDEPRLLHAARLAGEATYHYGDHRLNPTVCTGLASGGELLLELFRVTGEEAWQLRAREFCEKILSYRAALPEGDAWPTDEPGLFSPDFLFGGSGTGYFLLRCESAEELPSALLGPWRKLGEDQS